MNEQAATQDAVELHAMDLEVACRKLLAALVDCQSHGHQVPCGTCKRAIKEAEEVLGKGVPS